MKSCRHKAFCYLIGAVCVGDPRKGLQGWSDHEGTRSGAILLSLTQQLVQRGENWQNLIRHGSNKNVPLTMSDSRQDTSWRTQGSRQFCILFTFCRDVSVRTCGETASETKLPADRTFWCNRQELLPSGSWSSWLTGWWWVGWIGKRAPHCWGTVLETSRPGGPGGCRSAPTPRSCGSKRPSVAHRTMRVSQVPTAASCATSTQWRIQWFSRLYEQPSKTSNWCVVMQLWVTELFGWLVWLLQLCEQFPSSF